MRVSLSYLFSFQTHDRASLQIAPRDLRLSTFDKKNPRHSIEQQGIFYLLMPLSIHRLVDLSIGQSIASDASYALF